MGVAVCLGCLGEAYRARKLAHQLAAALPIGPNVVLLISYVYLVIVPEIGIAGKYEDGWRAGVFACFLTGLFEAHRIPPGLLPTRIYATRIYPTRIYATRIYATRIYATRIYATSHTGLLNI
jgi:hypothetical protein